MGRKKGSYAYERIVVKAGTNVLTGGTTHLNMAMMSGLVDQLARLRREGLEVLLVTSGTGIVATDGEEHRVGAGEIIHIPAGEKHWHGATPDTAFSHISLTAADSKTEQLEP